MRWSTFCKLVFCKEFGLKTRPHIVHLALLYGFESMLALISRVRVFVALIVFLLKRYVCAWSGFLPKAWRPDAFSNELYAQDLQGAKFVDDVRMDRSPVQYPLLVKASALTVPYTQMLSDYERLLRWPLSFRIEEVEPDAQRLEQCGLGAMAAAYVDAMIWVQHAAKALAYRQPQYGAVLEERLAVLVRMRAKLGLA